MGTESAEGRVTRTMSKAMINSQSSVIISNSYDSLSQIQDKADRFLAGETDSDDMESVFSENEHEDTMIEKQLEEQKLISELEASNGKSTTEVLLPHFYKLESALSSLTRQVAHPIHGLRAKVKGVSLHAQDNTDRIHALEVENKTLKENQRIMIGLLQKQAEEIENMKSKTEDLTTRSMRENIVLHNWDYVAPQDPGDLRKVVLDFMRDKLKIPADEREIYVAHKLSENSKAIVARINPALKNEVFENIKNINDLKNHDNKPVFITDQQPEGLRTRRKYAKEMCDELLEKNEGKPDTQKVKAVVKKDKLFINKELYKNPCQAPQPKDILESDSDEPEKIEKVKFIETEIQGEKGSTFRGLGAKITSRAELRRAYKKARRNFPAATHVMCAYTFKKSKDENEYGKQDDGEWGGSHRILEAITAAKATNVAVFVVRQFGGLEIGMNRFSHIKTCADGVLKKLDKK